MTWIVVYRALRRVLRFQVDLRRIEINFCIIFKRTSFNRIAFTMVRIAIIVITTVDSGFKAAFA